MFKNSHRFLKVCSAPIVASLLFASALTLPLAAANAEVSGQRPALVISKSPVPEALLNRAYSKPTKVREITPEELIGRSYYKETETMVSRKLNDLRSELAILQDKVGVLSSALTKAQRSNEGYAAQYYAAVATINTQLQAGTTPGNPRLLERFKTAETTLENLGGKVSDLNQISIDASRVATESSFLLDSARATYGLSGAVEEDHVELAELEDQVAGTIVLVERLLNTVNDDISRTNAYLSSERNQLRTLSAAVTNGNLYGRSFADRPFSGVQNIHRVAANSAPQQQAPAYAAPAPIGASAAAAPPADKPDVRRPLVKIRFDSSDVEYEQPLYGAVDEALKRYPDTTFHVVAVHPSQGNAASTAIESTRARRNAKRVLRTMSQIGVADERVDLTQEASAQVDTSEVHIYIQ